jgi:hypothetical protein
LRDIYPLPTGTKVPLPTSARLDQSVRTNKQIVKFSHDMDKLIPSYILDRILYTSAVSRNQIIYIQQSEFDDAICLSLYVYLTKNE